MKIRNIFITSILIMGIFLPLIPLILWSFSDKWFFPAALPQAFGIRGWSYLFSTGSAQFLAGIRDSFLIALTTAFLSLVLAIPAARSLCLKKFRMKPIILFLLTLPMIVPPMAVSMGLHYWFIHLNLAEKLSGVILVHLSFSLPYSIFVLHGTYGDFNPDFEDQARCLGASRAKTFFYVTLPLIRPGITVAALFSFLLSWSQYLATLIIGGGKILTLPILLFALMDSGDKPVAAAASLLFVLPAFLALIISSYSLGKRGLEGIR